MNLDCNIYVTIVSTFGIILIGYFFGRCNVIAFSQGKGISLYMVYVALPVLIFKAMVTVNFKAINWYLWAGIALGKAIVFLVVVILTYVFQKGNFLGKAGLFGIFATQSNDFALGLPILMSIFNNEDNRYLVDYLYLSAPISLALLNPIGYAMMEYEKAKIRILNDSVPSESINHANILGRTVLTTLKAVATNPLFFMILFGVAFNFIFHQQIPTLLSKFIDNIANSFGATALFYLGWSLGSKATKPRGLSVLLPCILVLTKGVVLPLVMKLTVTWMVKDTVVYNSTGNGSELVEQQATFGVIYGSIPTAPTVVVFASVYNLAEDIVASGLVLGTILFLPILFATIQMVRVLNMKSLVDFCNLSNTVVEDVSILNWICCAWVLIVFLLLRLHKRSLHKYTLVFVVFQFLIGLHGIFFNRYASMDNIPAKRFLLWFLMFTMYGYCTWAIVVVLSVGFLSSPTYKRISRYLTMGALLLPVIIASVMTAAYPKMDLPSAYLLLHCKETTYGLREIFLTLNGFLQISIVVTLVKMNKSVTFRNLFSREEEVVEPTQEEVTPLLNESTTTPESGYFYSDMSIQGHHSAQGISSIKEEELKQLTASGYLSKFHLVNHIILILLIGFVSFVNSAAGFWYYASQTRDGGWLFKELQMLGAILTFSQSFFTFTTFGFLKELFLLPIFEQCFACFGMLRRNKKVILPDVSDLDADSKMICNRFVCRHYQTCANEIVTDVCFGHDSRMQIFKGVDLVDWLLSSGLCEDRGEGVTFGNKLLSGRIIRHVNNEHYFYDLPYFYVFMSTGENDEHTD